MQEWTSLLSQKPNTHFVLGHWILALLPTIPCSLSCLSGLPLCFLAKSVTADFAHLLRAQRRPYPTAVGWHWPDNSWLKIAQESKIPQIAPSYSPWGCEWAGVRKPFTANLNIYFLQLFTTSELIFTISRTILWVTSKTSNLFKAVAENGLGEDFQPSVKASCVGGTMTIRCFLWIINQQITIFAFRVDTAQPFDGVVHGPNRWESWLLSSAFSEKPTLAWGRKIEPVELLLCLLEQSLLMAWAGCIWRCYLYCHHWLLLLRTEPGCSVQGTGGLKTYLKVLSKSILALYPFWEKSLISSRKRKKGEMSVLPLPY